MSLLTATAELDLSALATNVKTIKQLAPHSQMLAVLKANAYGHGLVKIAKALAKQTKPEYQVDAFGVARIGEALELRKAGITTPIVLLEGFFSVKDLPVISANNLHTIVHNQTQLDAICQANRSALQQPIPVWLKIDTGMHRLGINPEEFDYYYQTLSACENVADDLVFISHLSSSDEINNDKTAQQLALFSSLTHGYRGKRSLSNSGATLTRPETHFDWVRPGLMMYGINPMTNEVGAKTKVLLPSEIQPVMTLKSSLIAVRHLKAGESVGYSGTWQSTVDTVIGVVAIGYGDGYPRHAINGTPVLVNGRRASLVGRVSMDMITVDLGVDSTDKVGDEVTLWGKHLPIEEIAECATTIAYELLCNITRRVQVTVI